MTTPTDPLYFNSLPVTVTGAAGFIGSHLVEALLAKGARVRALVKYNSRQDWGHLQPYANNPHPNLEVCMGDITDPFWVMRMLKDQHTVFHLAALIGIPYSYVAPQHYVNVNVQGTLNVLEACKLHGVQKLVQTSTSETYGSARYTPQDEQHPLTGQSPYAASKIAADKLAESYFCSFDLPVATIRPFNAYGPRQSLRAVIPTIVSQALTQPVIQLGSLATTRDFTYVEDTVQAFLQVGYHPQSVGKVWNAGSGQMVSIGDIANTVLTLLNMPDKPIEVNTERVRPANSEVTCLLANSQQLYDLSGWQPTTPFAVGLSHVIQYWQGLLSPNGEQQTLQTAGFTRYAI
jgi:NAD dependent epimerase/dehydratase